MNPIDELLLKYDNRHINEADTRFKIIDTILKQALKWPIQTVDCEKFIEGDKADYVLNRKNNTPILIIESKSSSTYFSLPNNPNSNKNYQKIVVEKLMSDINIKSAILQVKDYCENLGCNYAAVTNGFEWIFFQLNPNNRPWKKLPAFVIRNLNFFKDDYTLAYNLFSYEAIVNNNSLRRNIGIIRANQEEIFNPKDSIITYNTPVNSNSYAPILNTISRKYLGPIPIGDNDFMNKCYVTNKGHYDDLQKNVQGFVYDSLTPFFKNQGFRDFSDDKKGGAFASKIQEIIKKENLDNVMILFGGRGSGKSTFLKRFFYHIKPREIELYSQISIVDLLNSSQSPYELTNEIWSKVRESIDIKKFYDGSKDELIELYSDQFSIFQKQFLKGIDTNSIDYHRLVSDFLLKCKSDIKYTCERLSFNIKSKGRGLIIIIDNLDQLKPELQDVCFLTATEISKKLSCLVIISMREERFYRIKTKGVLDAYTTIPGFHLSSPVIPDVIIKRLTYILDKIKTSNDLVGDFGISNDTQLKMITSFLSICNKEIKNVKSAFSSYIRHTTHGDVRMALDYFKGFLTSGYTNINEMAPHSDWKFQIHQVIKPMMIPDRFFYDERLSKVPNLFQVRNETNSSHFSGIRILDLLNSKSHDRPSEGFIDAKFLIQQLDDEYDLKEDCEKHLNIFLSKGLVESSNRLEEYSQDVDQIRITAFGKYCLDKLAFDFTYLDLICLDCGLFNENLFHTYVRAATRELDMYYNGDFMSRIKSRIKRVDLFISYLDEQEKKEFQELNLPCNTRTYSNKMRERFEKQKTAILASANRKLEKEYI